MKNMSLASQADRTYLEEVKGEESSAILERISQCRLP